MIDALFNSGTAIAASGFSCLLIGFATAWRCASFIPLGWTIAYLALVACRLMIGRRYKSDLRRHLHQDRWAWRYAVGAIATAAMLGVAAGLAIALDLPTALLAALAAIGSAGGIAGRSSALPRLAALQCALLVTPTAIAGFWSSEPANVMLAPTAVGYGAALFSFIRHYYSEISALIVARLDDAALARLDPLTNIPNRRSFEEKLAEMWPADTRPSEPLALLLVDLDHFRRYNDLYGHSAGDECLRHIALALRDMLGPDDVIARHGGEEFAILLPHCSLEQALIMANRSRQTVIGLRIEQAMRTDEHEVVTISIGVGASSAALSAQHLIEMADKALYRAKAAGRNRVCPDGAQTVVALQRAEQEKRLKRRSGQA